MRCLWRHERGLAGIDRSPLAEAGGDGFGSVGPSHGALGCVPGAVSVSLSCDETVRACRASGVWGFAPVRPCGRHGGSDDAGVAEGPTTQASRRVR
jgi:hypothetical protein